MKKFFNLQRFANVTKVSLTSGSDVYTNLYNNKVIYALGGNDNVISGWGKKNVTVYGGKGNDSIGSNWYNNYGEGTNLLMLGEVGNDYLHSVADKKVTLSGGAGKDTIVCDESENLKLYGGAGNDSINFYNCKTVVVTGDAGNDYIYNYAVDKVTVTGGKGNDTLELGYDSSKNNLIKYASGDGNDTILNFDSNDTIQITSGSYSTTKSGSDFIVKVGKKKITLKGAVNNKYDKINIINSSGELATYNDWSKRTELTGDIGFVNTSNKVTLTAATKDGYVGNVADQVLMKGGKGSTHLENNYGSKVTMVGGISSDRIYNTSGKNVKISGGAGNDYIESYGDSYGYADNASINGGAGDDEIYCSWSSNNTIIGGKGDDFISVTSSGADSQNVFKYATGDGNDTIYGFGESDTLKITKGSYKAKVSGNDVIVTVGKGKITLVDAAVGKISITNSKGKTTTKTYGSSTSALFEENNFITSDNLSEITENNLTPTALEKISSTKFENLTAENNFVTYSEK